MKFIDDGEVAENLVPPTSPAKRMLTGGQDALANDIVGFLQRPIHVNSSAWTSSQGILSELIPAISLPGDFIKFEMVNEKLRGFRYLRCDFMVEVQFNAQPFNAGAVIVWHEPLADQLNKRPSSVYHLGGISGYPNVIYKCGDATKVRLRIPFYGLVSHYDLCAGLGAAGQVHFTCLSTLTGGVDVDFTVFLWAENIDISMPTGQVIRPPPTYSGPTQSGVDEQPQTTRGETAADTIQVERPPRKPQVKKDMTMLERMQKERWVSTGLKALSQVSASLALVPPLSSFASMFSATTAAGAKVAASYGWSKPLDTLCEPVQQLAVARHMQNSNGDSKAKMMSLDANIACDIPTEVFGTDEDEMSFRTILSRKIFTDSFKWNKADQPSKVLWSWPVDPLWCKQQEVSLADPVLANGIQCQSTYLSYLAMNAAFWRGAIVYDIEAVKTVFHSGRLRVTFVPGATLLTDFATIDYNRCYSEIYDLREQGSMQFRVPFTWNQPWKGTETTLRPDGTFSVYPTGMIYISVVNSLRNPSAAADTVEFLVFSKAGDDFQLAYPQVRDDFRLIRGMPLHPPAYSGQAQSGIYSCNENTEFDPNALAVGEIFTGFRQWLKRYHPWKKENGFSSLDFQYPFWFNATYQSNNPLQDLMVHSDAFDVASQLYRFWCGSIRTLHVRDPSVPFFARINPGGVPSASAGVPYSVSAPTLEPIVELGIPFYQKYPALPTGTGYPRLNNGMTSPTWFQEMPYNYGTEEQVSPTSYSVYTAMRSTGEDFSFGLLVGPPMVMLIVPLP